jgi:hypothetical protein
MSTYADFRDGKSGGKQADWSQEENPYEFDDLLLDNQCYRAFFLFLVDTQRYSLLLFWKECHDFGLDTLESYDHGEHDEELSTEALSTLRNIHRKFVLGPLAKEVLWRRLPPLPIDLPPGVNLADRPIALAQYLLHAVQKVERDLRHTAWTMFLGSPHHHRLLADKQTRTPTGELNRGVGSAVRSLASFLKQQPATQDMLVVTCQSDVSDNRLAGDSGTILATKLSIPKIQKWALHLKFRHNFRRR